MKRRRVDPDQLCLVSDIKPACAVRSLYKIDHCCRLQRSYAVLAVRPGERLEGSVLVVRSGLSFKTTFSSEL